MSAQQIHSPATAAAAPENAGSDSPAQESSDEAITPRTALDAASAVILRRIADVAELHGWHPNDARLSVWLEQQLADLDRYRSTHHTLNAELRAQHRENLRTAQHRSQG